MREAWKNSVNAIQAVAIKNLIERVGFILESAIPAEKQREEGDIPNLSRREYFALQRELNAFLYGRNKDQGEGLVGRFLATPHQDWDKFIREEIKNLGHLQYPSSPREIRDAVTATPLIKHFILIELHRDTAARVSPDLKTGVLPPDRREQPDVRVQEY